MQVQRVCHDALPWLISFSLGVMKTLVTVWVVFLFTSFAISTLALSAVQTRLIRKGGWRVFRRHRLLDLYWRDLGTVQRVLIWPGLIACFLTLFAATLSVFFRHT